MPIKHRCLIVDDSVICRSVMNAFLKENFICEFAVNGLEAIEMHRIAHHEKRPYTLLCIDIAMPVLDGLDALRKIRAFEREIDVPQSMEAKAIIVSSQSSPSAVFKAFYHCGAQGYVVKPVNVKDLNTQLEQAGLQLVGPPINMTQTKESRS